MFKNYMNTFRLVSYIEGISYLLLVFIAMPVKYILDNPILVKYSGMGHGILFILFIILLVVSAIKYKFENIFSFKLFIAAQIPFGFIYIENRLKRIDISKTG
jgi:integral membrane protein